MLHDLMVMWFERVEAWGYVGVFVMMAIESTVLPLPSEVVIPPAAYHAAQGRMSFWGVVIAATLGSWAGSALPMPSRASDAVDPHAAATCSCPRRSG